MRIVLPFDFQVNFRNFLQRAGYTEINDYHTKKTSYVKRLSRDYYPRFHVYLETDKDNRQILNLHLDQKKPSYQGSSAHSGEYDSELVKNEAAMIEGLIKNQMDNQAQKPVEQNLEKKGFWSKFFG
ncbi:MAG: hypothetical protein WCW26_00100 [Candidatus Buchananbacteria bacterium]